MGNLKRISEEEAQSFLEKGKLMGPVFEEKFNIKFGFFYDTLGIRYFSPAKVFWRRIGKSAGKYNSDTIVTNHYLFLSEQRRTCIEGTVKYYVSEK